MVNRPPPSIHAGFRAIGPPKRVAQFVIFGTNWHIDLYPDAAVLAAPQLGV